MKNTTRVLVMRHKDTGELRRVKATGDTPHRRAWHAREQLGAAWYFDNATRTAQQLAKIPMVDTLP